MQKNSRKVGLLLAFVSMFTTAFFVATAFAQFVGPGSTPPAGGGTLQVDTNYNVGLGTSSALITPTGGVSFGRLFTISSSSNPGFSLLTGTNRYAWYADTASGTLSLAGSTNGSGGNRVFQITPGGTVYGYDYHSISNQNYYVDPGLSIMPYAANLAGNVLLSGSRTLQIGTTGCQYLYFANASNTVAYCNNQFNFNTTQSQGFTFTGGNVGIGTTTPTWPLTVSSPSASFLITAQNTGNNPIVIGAKNNTNSTYIGTEGGTGGQTVVGTLPDASFLANQGAYALQFGTNNNIRMTIDSSGNVGIGTTTPSSALQVIGNVNIGTGYNDATQRVLNVYGNGSAPGQVALWGQASDQFLKITGKGSGTSNPAELESSYGLELTYGEHAQENGFRINQTTSTNTVFQILNNYVGIGTTSPSTAGLVLQTNVSGVGLDMTGNRIANLGVPVNPNDAATKNYVDSAYAPGGSSGNVGGTGTSGYIPKWTGTSTIANSVVYQSGSNIGIGTTSPGATLEVYNSTANIPSAYVSGDFAGQVDAAQFIVRGKTDTNMQLELGYNTTNHYGSINAIWQTHSQSPLVLNPGGGAVGIGTTTPTTAGLVVSTNVSTVGIDVQNNRIANVGTPINAADAATKSYVDSAITSGVSGGITGTTNYIAKFTSANAVGNSLVYDNGTNVGIGTASPGAKLEVQGSVYVNHDGGYGFIADSGQKRVGLMKYVGIEGSLVHNNAIPLRFGMVNNTDITAVTSTNGNDSNFTTQMIISTAGYVGINTVSPGTNLDVNGNAQSSIYYDRDNTNYYMDLAANTMPYSIVTAGYVGVGTTTPSNPLTVYSANGNGILTSVDAGQESIYLHGSNYNSYVDVKASKSGSYNSELRLYNPSSNYGIVQQNYGNYLALGYNTESPNSLVVNSSGNVGIGTVSPGTKLDVSGDVYLGHQGTPISINSDFGGSGTVLGANEYYSGGWNLFSTSQYGFQIDFHTATSSTPAVNFNYTAPAANPVSYTTVMSMYPGTGSVGLDLHNYRIQNLGTPINAADAVTKSYVDSAIVTGVSGGVSGTTGYIAKFTGTNSVGNSAIYQSGSNIGIGTASPANELQVTAPFVASSTPNSSSGNGQLIVQGTGTSRTPGLGAAISFVVPASSDGSNWWEQGRVLVTPDNTNTSDASGRMYLQTRAYFSSAWNWINNLVLTSNGDVGVNMGSSLPGTTLDVAGNINVGSVLYDRANTNYYLNPSANIMPYALNTGGGINIGGGGTFSGALAVNGASVTLSSATQLVINSTSSSAIQMNQGSITGVYKLSVNTVDPVYNIGHVNYATYAPDIIGIKTEVFGKVTLTNAGVQSSPTLYSAALNIRSAPKGSDLWLFWQTINEGKDMKDISVYLTPDFAGQAWYTLEPAKKEIVIYAIPNDKFQIPNTSYEVSYHLVAPRYDSEKWTNYAPAGEQGTALPLK